VEVGVVTLPQNVPNLEVLPVHRDEMQVVMPANHPLAKQRSVTLDEMVQYPLIMPKTGRTRVMLDRLLRDKRNELQISMELASVETIKKFVGAGLGLSLLSKSYAQAEVAAGLLKLVPLEGIKIQRELGLIYRRDRYLSLPAKVFIEAVRASIHPLKREGGAQAEKNAAGPGPESDTE
jgi:DNA-binding transcriptional LysR family regulator